MNAKSFNLSIQGASHIKKNKECQDNSASYFDENCAVAIVCDGHGGDDYMRSAIGSYYACEVAEMNIRNFLENVSKDQFLSNPDQYLRSLKASIISGWNNEIYQHYDTNPFTEKEIGGISEKAKKKYLQEGRIESAYGTTLIAVAMTKEYWFGIHIGDGKCVAVNPAGKFVQPIPWDPKCFLNATTSICDSDALEHFRHFYSEKLPVAVFVGSDGIDDCFKNNEQLHNLYKTILYSFGTSDFDEAVEDLKDYLPRLSAKGSGDDVSISAMFDFDLLPGLEIVKDFDREKEKARVAENARIEAEKLAEEKRRIDEEHARIKAEQEAKKRAEEARRRAEEEKRRAAEMKRRAEEERRRKAQEEKEKRRMTERSRRTIIKRQKFCTECGEPLLPGMKYCGNCGTLVAAPTAEEREITIINLKPYGKETTGRDTSEVSEAVDKVENSVTEKGTDVDVTAAEPLEEKSSTVNTEAENETELTPENTVADTVCEDQEESSESEIQVDAPEEKTKEISETVLGEEPCDSVED